MTSSFEIKEKSCKLRPYAVHYFAGVHAGTGYVIVLGNYRTIGFSQNLPCEVKCSDYAVYH